MLLSAPLQIKSTSGPRSVLANSTAVSMHITDLLSPRSTCTRFTGATAGEASRKNPEGCELSRFASDAPE